MTNDNEFVALAVGLQTHRDGDQFRINFSNNTSTLAVVIPRAGASALAAGLLRETGYGGAVPISGQDVQAGRWFVPTAIHTSPQNGSRTFLTIQVRLPDQDREVAIPIGLSPADVAALIEQLGAQRE